MLPHRYKNYLDVNQPLLQTIMVNRGTKRIEMRVETWVRRSGRFFGLMERDHWVCLRLGVLKSTSPPWWASSVPITSDAKMVGPQIPCGARSLPDQVIEAVSVPGLMWPNRGTRGAVARSASPTSDLRSTQSVMVTTTSPSFVAPGGQGRARVHFPFNDLELKVRLQALELALLRSGGQRRGHTKPGGEDRPGIRSRPLRHAVRGRRSQQVRCQHRGRRGEGEPLRVSRFNAPESANLPWEFLFDRRQSDSRSCRRAPRWSAMSKSQS